MTFGLDRGSLRMAYRALLGAAICLVASEALGRGSLDPAAADAGPPPWALGRDHLGTPRAAGTPWSAGWGWGTPMPGSVRDELIQANKLVAANDKMQAFTEAYQEERGKLLSDSKELVERADELEAENAKMKAEVGPLRKRMRLAQKEEGELRSELTALLTEKAELLRRNKDAVGRLTATQQELKGQKETAESLAQRLEGRGQEFAARVEDLRDHITHMASRFKAREGELKAQIEEQNRTVHEVWRENTKLRDSSDALVADNVQLRKEVDDLKGMVGSLKGIANDLGRAG